MRNNRLSKQDRLKCLVLLGDVPASEARRISELNKELTIENIFIEIKDAAVDGKTNLCLHGYITDETLCKLERLGYEVNVIDTSIYIYW